MKVAGKTVCVTGAGGFIGSALCRQLVARGAKVIALDDFSFGCREHLAGLEGQVEIVQADTRVPASLRCLSQSEIVFHLAAVESRQACQRDFASAFNVNVWGTKNVLSFCAERVVFMSSMMVYGEPRYLPINEVHPLDGYEPYCTTKVMGEYLCRAYGFLTSLRFTVVRSTNVYGPGQAEDRLIPSLILQARRERKIEVWNPAVVRDLLYVDDCARGLVEVAESDAAIGQTINMGTGQGTTTAQLADVICQYIKVPWHGLDRPLPVTGKVVVDATKMHELTGWQPEVTLEDGIRKACEWYREG